MKQMPGLFLLLILCVFFSACDQEPLFWDISREYPPIEPIIKGSPSRIVAVTYSNPEPDVPDRTVLYVSNGTVWDWDISASANPNWQKMSRQPGGKIKTLAAAGGYLFSLNWSGSIQKWNGAEWSSVNRPGGSGTPEQIFGAGDYLFAGSLTGPRGEKHGYSILAMDAADNTMTLIKGGTGLLLGAVENSGTYYLGTRGDGVLSTSNPLSDLNDTPPVSGTDGSSIIGLVEHGGFIIGVTTGSQIVYSDGGAFTQLASYGNEFSGAIASWEDNEGNRLLLLGLQHSSGSFGYGYRELVWKAKGGLDDNKILYAPGGNADVSSVQQDLQYISAIGNHAVYALYAVPGIFGANPADEEGRPIVFASTQKDGFWSYRIRKGRAQWNGEDNSN